VDSNTNRLLTYMYFQILLTLMTSLANIGHGRFVIKAFKVPLTIGQLRVVPGDLLMADSGGVVRRSVL
jgi:regulator of RNase E activity RraA